eukprot:6896570-Pyramimonas_sp.AAC.1
MGPLGRVRCCLGKTLGAHWAVFARGQTIVGTLGCTWGRLADASRPSGAPSVPIRMSWGRPWGRLGFHLGPSWNSMTRVGQPLGPPVSALSCGSRR